MRNLRCCYVAGYAAAFSPPLPTGDTNRENGGELTNLKFITGSGARVDEIPLRMMSPRSTRERSFFRIFQIKKSTPIRSRTFTVDLSQCTLPIRL